MAGKSKWLKQFGPFMVDPEVRVLSQAGETVPLPPKAFDVLLALLLAGGGALTREQLLQAVWGDAIVEEGNLTQAVSVLRKALGEDGQSARYVETIPRRGYRFVAAVRDVEIQGPERDGNGAVGATQPLLGAKGLIGAVAIAALTVLGIWFGAGHANRGSVAALQFTQLTNFPGSVHSPALSRDGKMLAFIRGTGQGPGDDGEIYVKVLPDGQPTELTHDGTIKTGLAFSPDNSQVVYTSPTNRWSTFSIPITGGTPTLLMANASGLTWVEPGRVLFSEIRDAPRMAVATATVSRAGLRDVYVPSSPQGMAHYSHLSLDKQSVLIVEMTTDFGWTQCRVVPFDGSSEGKPVAPPDSACTDAAWSPDGHWMYFAAEVDGESHLWRQAFPSGRPEQLTAGLDQERGLAIDPDGHSLITSVGTSQSVLWYHDTHGERPLSGEGFAYRPQVSADGTKVYYLVRRAEEGSLWIGELWSADVERLHAEKVLPDFLVGYFNVSPDGRYVVFDSPDRDGRLKLWIAMTDRSEPPRRLTPDGSVQEQRPFFGASGDIYFMREESRDIRFVYKMKKDGSERRKRSDPITFLVNISPDEKWAVVWNTPGVLLLPLAGGAPHEFCRCGAGPAYQTSPRIGWSGDGKYVVVPDELPEMTATMQVLPWNGGSFPTSGHEEAVPIREVSVALGPSAATYAFTRLAEQSNLYRVHLPE